MILIQVNVFSQSLKKNIIILIITTEILEPV